MAATRIVTAFFPSIHSYSYHEPIPISIPLSSLSLPSDLMIETPSISARKTRTKFAFGARLLWLAGWLVK